MQPTRDHLLPPDVNAYRHALHPHGRVIVIAPTRAACETIELALHSHIDTLLERQHGATVRQWTRDGKGFGIVAGTGTGKTLGIRVIGEEILAEPLVVGVVNREREATPETPGWNVVIVTTGIARRWLADDLITRRDTIIVDEIHQTSAELELCLALGKRSGCRFIWLSATVDPKVYRDYLGSDEVLETSAFDPELKAKVTVLAKQPAQYLDDQTVRRFISARRGVAVFLPTRAEVERLGAELRSRFPRLVTAFYHGGEPIRVLRPFLEGEVAKPYLLAMTAAGQSALNLPGLDTVVIYDRIRENLKLMRREKLSDIVNRSINQTLSRTVLTAGLTFLTVLALYLFGGEVLRGFSLALVIGILIGTYSSIAIAAPILVAYQDWRSNRGKRPVIGPGGSGNRSSGGSKVSGPGSSPASEKGARAGVTR